jgi:hypothetical protein
MTAVLRIEHPVDDFDRWHAAFANDPIGRRRGGVTEYRVMRACDDPKYVLIDLEFETPAAAEAFLGSLRELWGRVDVMRDPRARVVELVEAQVVSPA